MKSLILIITILLFAVSCSTVHISKRQNSLTDKRFTSKNVTDLSGTYSNKRDANDTTIESWSLWQKLFGSAKAVEHWQKAVVKLQILQSKKLEASLFVDSTVIERRTAAFKLTNGYLQLKRQYKTAWEIGPVIWAAGTFQVFLGISRSNRLTIINAHDGIGFFFVIPFSVASDQDDYEYSRL